MYYFISIYNNFVLVFNQGFDPTRCLVNGPNWSISSVEVPFSRLQITTFNSLRDQSPGHASNHATRFFSRTMFSNSMQCIQLYVVFFNEHSLPDLVLHVGMN